MQNIYSPNRFYTTFLHDNSWIFVKTLNLIKKLIFSFLYKHMIFPLFLLIYINSFFLNYVKHVFGSNNKDNNND